MVTVREEEMRKGPWTEQEDMQLVCTVRLLGDRRWDSIARVSGLNRTSKGCRMRWMNYLHPGLKKGRLSPQEERLVIELHARWGNSWSRIAQRLPGRTDNDIKNYWKTRMRTKAQEREREMSTSSSPSSSSFSLTSYQSCFLLDSTAPVDGMSMMMSCGDRDTTTNNFSSVCITIASTALESTQLQAAVTDGFPMDQIWREMETPVTLLQQVPSSLPQGIHQADGKACTSSIPACPPATTTSALWDDQCPDEVFWNMDAEEMRMLFGSTIWLWRIVILRE